MKRTYTFRPHAERAELKKRILRLTKGDPDLPPAEIAATLRCSHVTVRRVQREAGVYKPRGAHGVVLGREGKP